MIAGAIHPFNQQPTPDHHKSEPMSNAYEPPSGLSDAELPTDESETRSERPVRSKLLGVIAFFVGAAFAVWTISIADGISPFVLMVALWVASPYLVITIAAGRVSSFVPTMILGCTLVLTSSFGVWAFDKIDEDAQGGLILIFIPAYQFVGALILAIMAVLVDRWAERASRQ